LIHSAGTANQKLRGTDDFTPLLVKFFLVQMDGLFYWSSLRCCVLYDVVYYTMLCWSLSWPFVLHSHTLAFT